MHKKRIVSGMRPTGPLHLGHYFGVLQNWVELQKNYGCFFFVADWHALTTEYAEPRKIRHAVPELVKDWVAGGLDPEKTTLFLQSELKEHAEMTLIMSMITPLGWLERNPTYKEIKEELVAKDLNTHGFLGYPVLMATDILMYKPQFVPVGQDQLPHLELTREIARRFNYLYGDLFPEPEAKLTESAKLPGLDGRKMSKSYDNCIYLSETMDSIAPKIKGMLTDTNRKRKNDPGDPEVCNLFPYHLLLTDGEKIEEIRKNCAQAKWGCFDCKKLLLQNLERFLEPIMKKRKELDDHPEAVWEILRQGNKAARENAQETMREVRGMIGFEY